MNPFDVWTERWPAFMNLFVFALGHALLGGSGEEKSMDSETRIATSSEEMDSLLVTLIFFKSDW